MEELEVEMGSYEEKQDEEEVFKKSISLDKTRSIYRTHYLKDKYCYQNQTIPCSNYCAWFDEEEKDCRMFTYMFNSNFLLEEINDSIEYLGDSLDELRRELRKLKK